MKEGIHPKYGDATITCACGNVIHTRSTKPEMQVNTCSGSAAPPHQVAPFYFHGRGFPLK